MSVSRAMRQIILIGFICFGTIGMFNAMSSIGNAGKHSPTAQNLAITSSSIAYIIGFLIAGGTHNMLGPRPCVAFGGFTFFLYAGAMMLAKDDDNSLYPPLAGILLGLGAGCIWVTQGAMMMSYPTEDNKGKYIACFWAIFNLGAVLGSVIAWVMNSAPGMDQDDISPATYYVFMAIMGLATLLVIFLARPSTIVRDNGDPIIVAKFAGVKAETKAILSVFCDWRMLLLIPAFFFSNFSYTYQFNDFNGSNFNMRTRSLNSILFWVAQIIGALVLGHLLDRVPLKRPKRALLGLSVVALLFMATWVGAFLIQDKHKWNRKVVSQESLIDYQHGSIYTGPLTIYTMFGFCDAAFAVYCYWLMGALSNKHDELSRYAGFFKSIQSLGSAVAAPLDMAQTPLLEYLITNWVLCAISLAAMFLVCRTITDTTIDLEEEEDNYYDEQDLDLEEGDESSLEGSTREPTRDNPCPAAHQPSHSFETDSSTLCVSSQGSKTECGSRTSDRLSGCWRSNSRTSGLQDQDPEKKPAPQSHPRGPTSLSRDPSKRRSTASASSLATPTPTLHISTTPTPALPSLAYYPPQRTPTQDTLHPPTTPTPENSFLTPGISLYSRRIAPCRAPSAASSSSTSSAAPKSAIPHASPAFTPTLPFSRTNHEAPDRQPSSSSSSSSSSPPHSPREQPPHPAYFYPPTLVLPQSAHHPSEPLLSPSAAGSSSWASSPTFVLSQEYSPSILLYNGSSSSSSSPLDALHPQAPWTNYPLSDIGAGIGPSTQNGFLQPNDPLHLAPQRSSIAGSSAYDEEQDMDSAETCSISSMSSGHDSIPEMTDMSPIPKARPRDGL